MEIDHFVIFTDPGAPAARRLADVGLREGSARRHPGQGTANRRFFFDNAMLELLWIDDETEARSPATAPLRLWERGPGASACPLGVCFRPSTPGEAPPFRTTPYQPAYLPKPRAIDVASDAPAVEPLWFFLGFARRPFADDASDGEPRDHPAGMRVLTATLVTVPGNEPPSPAASAAVAAGLRIDRGPACHLELSFDHRLRHRADLRPDIPLTLCW